MTISVSSSTAQSLSMIGLGDFYEEEQPERMAWVVLLLRRLPDRPEWFPKGKWATVQHIEQQLSDCADDAARDIAAKGVADS